MININNDFNYYFSRLCELPKVAKQSSKNTCHWIVSLALKFFHATTWRVVSNFKKLVFITLLLLIFGCSAHCFVQSQANKSGKDIEKIYNYATEIKKHNLQTKIIDYSGYFLGTAFPQPNKDIEDVQDVVTYLKKLAINDEFNYTFKHMDCVHYVEMVLALAVVNNNSLLTTTKFEQKFERNLRKIRYKNGKATYLNRNHFTSVDWIPNNSFLLKDITAKIQPQHLVAKAVIDKCGFISFEKNIKKYIEQQNTVGKNFTKQDVSKILTNIDPQFACKEQTSLLPYIDLQDVVNNYSYYVQAFPEVSIVSIVRPNWDLTRVIGSHLNISHLGFVIKQGNNLIFRHASIDQMKVVELELKDYLLKWVDHPTIKGINVQGFIK